jgi:hypothetical protein
LIAEKHPKLKIIVQDLPGVEGAFKDAIPAESELAKRITFQAHDFMKPQPVVADVFFMKSVFHDWADKYAVQILSNLVPVLRPGKDKVIIVDPILPPAYDKEGNRTLPVSVRKLFYSLDLVMHATVNSKERRMDDWLALVKCADERFELKSVSVIPGQPFGIMEFMLKE